jgi:hypothetical protein
MGAAKRPLAARGGLIGLRVKREAETFPFLSLFGWRTTI